MYIITKLTLYTFFMLYLENLQTLEVFIMLVKFLLTLTRTMLNDVFKQNKKKSITKCFLKSN